MDYNIHIQSTIRFSSAKGIDGCTVTAYTIHYGVTVNIVYFGSILCSHCNVIVSVLIYLSSVHQCAKSVKIRNSRKCHFLSVMLITKFVMSELVIYAEVRHVEARHVRGRHVEVSHARGHHVEVGHAGRSTSCLGASCLSASRPWASCQSESCPWASCQSWSCRPKLVRHAEVRHV